MDIFLARQPIFDRKNNVFAYELLFRSGLQNFFTHTDPTEASSHLIADSFLLFGVEKVTGDKRAFINLTREVLLDDAMTLLPSSHYGAELDGNLQPDAATAAACQRLKDKGYPVILDDFVPGDKRAPLVALADILKVDLLKVDRRAQMTIIDRYGRNGPALLAEKVETPEAFQQAMALGFMYFQGYFFSKPTVISRRDVPGVKMHYLRMLQEINRPEIDIRQLEAIIKQDVSLTYNLLRYINSPFFGLRSQVSSISHALLALGEKEVKKWACLVALGRLGEDKPQELVVSALIRAKFCEGLAPLLGIGDQAQDLFLLGMFSMIHVLVGRPLEEVLMDIPLAEEIKSALFGTPNRKRAALDLVITYDKGDWQKFSELAASLRVQEKQVPGLYLKALEWATKTMP